MVQEEGKEDSITIFSYNGDTSFNSDFEEKINEYLDGIGLKNIDKEDKRDGQL